MKDLSINLLGELSSQHQSFEEHKHFGEEIRQESLKSTLQAAITDIEEQIDIEADKENQFNLQSKKVIFKSYNQRNKLEEKKYFIQKFQNQQNPIDDGVTRRFKFPHEFKGRPQSQLEFRVSPTDPLDLPEVGSSLKKIGDDRMVHN